MKKLFICCLFWLAGSSLLAQTLLIANNNAGATPGTNVFTGSTALQDAIAAAAAGDVIYVVPGPTDYGNIIIDKSLTIFGIGIRPQRDVNSLSSMVSVEVQASDVRLSGLNITNPLYLADGVTDISNILVENCRLFYILANTGNNVSNLIVRNNIIENVSGPYFDVSTLAVGALVTNNVFLGNAGNIRATQVSFLYNVFSAVNGDKDIFNDVDNCLFDHNIFYGVRVDLLNVGPGSTGNTWDNNLSFGNTVASYNVFEVSNNGNTTNTGNLEDMDPLFTNFPLSTVWNDSYDLTLQAGSPALNGSANNNSGEDIGPSGGPTPFDADGNLLPYIQSITMPAVIPVGNDLPVNIKAKGN
ncbi:MAG TPA: hypothetical protein ENJ39_00010 [Flammeovirgaceae bacterium]|nr:hypothetical protein [Flammeovirgaceae bacterium]